MGNLRGVIKMPRSDFKEVEVLRDADGVVAVVSERVTTGRISFMLGREFERDGKTERSPFISSRHIAGVRRLLDQLERHAEVLEDRARAERRMASGANGR